MFLASYFLFISFASAIDNFIPMKTKEDAILLSLDLLMEKVNAQETDNQNILDYCNISIILLDHLLNKPEDYFIISYVNEKHDNLLTLASAIYLKMQERNLSDEFFNYFASIIVKIIKAAVDQDTIYDSEQTVVMWLMETTNDHGDNFFLCQSNLNFPLLCKKRLHSINCIA